MWAWLYWAFGKTVHCTVTGLPSTTLRTVDIKGDGGEEELLAMRKGVDAAAEIRRPQDDGRLLTIRNPKIQLLSPPGLGRQSSHHRHRYLQRWHHLEFS